MNQIEFTISTVAVVILILTTVLLLQTRRWRISILLLAIQYVGVFLLVQETWPTGIAVIKLVVGWMAGAILGITLASGVSQNMALVAMPVSERIYNLIASSIVLLAAFTLAPQIQLVIPEVPLSSLWGSLIPIGMGLFNLGKAFNPFQIILGLLTVLSGFEILYANLEISLLLAGLMALVNLGLAMVGAYLLAYTTTEGIQ